MLAWSPELRYSVEELVAGLQLEMTQAGRPKRQGSASGAGAPGRRRSGLDSAPRGKRRPGRAAEPWSLQGAAGRWQARHHLPLGAGAHGAVDGGTAYFEPDDLWPIGGFKCLHGHCAERHIRDLLRMLDIEVNAARMKPTIRVMAGEIHRVVDAAERELAQSRRHYQRGGLIVTVVTDPGTRETRVQDISQPALVRALAGAATWERFDARSEDWVRTDPPARHAAVLFDSTSYPHLPVLNGLARQPYLRPDGSLMTAAGYDPATGMFGVFDAREFSVPDTPTRQQAEAALALLKILACGVQLRQRIRSGGRLGGDAYRRRPAQPCPCADVPCTGAYGGVGQVLPVRIDHGLCHPAAGNADHLSRLTTRNAESCCSRSCCGRRP